MARRADPFVRELSDGEAAHLLRQVRPGRNAVVRHRAILLFASFQGHSVTRIASMFEASAMHVAALIHAFNEQGFPPSTLGGAGADRAGSISTSVPRS